jgi:hypothetical protein
MKSFEDEALGSSKPRELGEDKPGSSRLNGDLRCNCVRNVSGQGPTYTYRAALFSVAVIVVVARAVLSVGVTALSDDVVALDFDGEVELRVRGGMVLEYRDPTFSGAVANTEVKRRIISLRLGRIAPLAAVLDRDAGRVDVVLGRGWSSILLVVAGAVRAGKLRGAASGGPDRDRLRLGS